MGPMTEQERQRVVSSLERSRDRLISAISGLSDAQWRFRPAQGSWSISECSDQIYLIERLLFQTVVDLKNCPADPERAEKVKGKDERLLKALADRDFKVRNPFPADPSGHSVSPQNMAQAFRELRAGILEYAVTTTDSLRDHVARHPLLKDLDGVQWLLLISAHCERHVAQIEEVKADAAYPRALAAG